MKTFLAWLLIGFSLSLCALITVQWYREIDSRHEIQKLTDTLHEKRERITSLEGQVKRTEAEVLRLDGIKKEQTDKIASNIVEIATLKTNLDRAGAEIEK